MKDPAKYPSPGSPVGARPACLRRLPLAWPGLARAARTLGGLGGGEVGHRG